MEDKDMSEDVDAIKEQLALETFLQDWIECGFNAQEAYLKRHPKVTKGSAAVMGGRMLSRVNLPDVLEARGLGRDVYYKKLKEGLEATRRISSFTEPDVDVPDFKVRRDYHKALGKVLNVEKDKMDITSDGKPIQIVIPQEIAEKNE